MIGKLTTVEIDETLKHQVIGRIGCHADGVTYVVPISYTYDGKYIYGHTREGMKVRIMRKNPDVCFEVEEMTDMANWKSVVLWGKFEELFEKEARSNALQTLVNRMLPLNSSETTHLTPEWPFPAKDINDIKGIVFRIKIEETSGRFEKNDVHLKISG